MPPKIEESIIYHGPEKREPRYVEAERQHLLKTRRGLASYLECGTPPPYTAGITAPKAHSFQGRMPHQAFIKRQFMGVPKDLHEQHGESFPRQGRDPKVEARKIKLRTDLNERFNESIPTKKADRMELLNQGKNLAINSKKVIVKKMTSIVPPAAISTPARQSFTKHFIPNELEASIASNIQDVSGQYESASEEFLDNNEAFGYDGKLVKVHTTAWLVQKYSVFLNKMQKF